MIPVITVLLATATACLTLAIATHKGDLLKGAPWWVEYFLFTLTCILYILAGVLAVRHRLKEKRKEETKLPSTSTPINIHLENIGNPIQSSVQRILTPPAAIQDHAEAKKPDIKFLPSEERPLSDFDQYAPAFSVVAACLRNDSIHDTRYDYAAHVIYKNAQGNEVTDMGRGLWLSSSSTTIRFPTGITQWLAIFLSRNGKLFKPVVERRRQTLAGKPIIISDIKTEQFKENIATVEVRLFREKTPPIVFTFTVHTRDGKTTLLLAPST